MRGDRLSAHMQAAEAYGALSHAKRLKVGAVMVKDDRVISVGYNGTPKGFDNTCEFLDETGKLVTKREVLHAESNCIAFAARHGTPTEGAALVITDSPCYECCKLIIQAGIKEVYFRNEYRDQSGLEFLWKNGVATQRVWGDEE